MADRDTKKVIQDIQQILKDNGFYSGDIDGLFGPKSKAALAALLDTHPVWGDAGRLLGDGTWDFMHARVQGEDILIENAVVTAFGGASDSMDSGETASGISTKDNPSYVGCALPMRRDSSPALRGSPIPKLPWKTEVIFSSGNKSLSTKLIDEGPAKWTKHSGDLTVAAAKWFDPNATANNFTKTMTIRIIGGAQYLK